MANRSQIFISYDSEDAKFAQRLAIDLKNQGARVWIAPDSILPGESWVDAIERGLRESTHTVIVLTPAGLRSSWVNKEMNVAIAEERKGKMKVIPLLVKQCEPPLIVSSYQMVIFQHDYARGLSQLTDMLGLQLTPERAQARTTTEHTQRINGLSPLKQDGMFFNTTHNWVRLRGHEATCGISDYGQEWLSDIVFIEFMVDRSDLISKDEKFVVVESVKTAEDLYMPLEGRITNINEHLLDSPELINSDPYGKGWLIKFVPVNFNRMSDLMSESAYKSYCRNL